MIVCDVLRASDTVGMSGVASTTAGQVCDLLSGLLVVSSHDAVVTGCQKRKSVRAVVASHQGVVALLYRVEDLP